MRILLLKAKGVSTSKFERQLKEWGVNLLTDTYDFRQSQWQDKKLTPLYLQIMAAEQFKRHGKRIDAILLLIPDKYWKTTTKGTHYAKRYSEYEIGAIKQRSRWEDSGRHEYMHMTDDYVLEYLGHGLEFVLGVKDFDEDVVHGRDPRFKEYEYDRPYAAIKPYVERAWRVRNK